MDEADLIASVRARQRRGHGGRALAARAVKAGAETIAPNGRAFTEDAIGMYASPPAT